MNKNPPSLNIYPCYTGLCESALFEERFAFPCSRRPKADWLPQVLNTLLRATHVARNATVTLFLWQTGNFQPA